MSQHVIQLNDYGRETIKNLNKITAPPHEKILAELFGIGPGLIECLDAIVTYSFFEEYFTPDYTPSEIMDWWDKIQPYVNGWTED